MNVEILKPYGKWQPGAKPDIMRSIAKELIAQGIAKEIDPVKEGHEVKKEQGPAPQMTVNNYFLAKDEEE